MSSKQKVTLGVWIREEDIQSEITIYCNAVQKQRGSSSSEDFDTRDELMLDGLNVTEKELATQSKSNRSKESGGGSKEQTNLIEGKAKTPQKKETAEEHADKIIQEAEVT